MVAEVEAGWLLSRWDFWIEWFWWSFGFQTRVGGGFVDQLWVEISLWEERSFSSDSIQVWNPITWLRLVSSYSVLRLNSWFLPPPHLVAETIQLFSQNSRNFFHAIHTHSCLAWISKYPRHKAHSIRVIQLPNDSSKSITKPNKILDFNTSTTPHHAKHQSRRQTQLKAPSWYDKIPSHSTTISPSKIPIKS